MTKACSPFDGSRFRFMVVRPGVDSLRAQRVWICMAHRDYYAREFLPHATETELEEFRAIRRGILPDDLDPARMGDWKLAVERLRAASDSRARDGGSNPVPDAHALTPGPIPGLPTADRRTELGLVRSWLAIGQRVGGMVFFDPPQAP